MDASKTLHPLKTLHPPQQRLVRGPPPPPQLHGSSIRKTVLEPLEGDLQTAFRFGSWRDLDQELGHHAKCALLQDAPAED